MIKLDADEHVVRKSRKHWFIFAVEVLGVLILAVLPYIVVWIGEVAFSTVPGFTELVESIMLDAEGWIAPVYAIWLLILWMLLFAFWTDYYLDVWIITNKRIFDIEQHGLFNREVSMFRVQRIQDVTIDVNGLLATILDYGDIHVQTAGTDEDFIMKGMADPQGVKRVINTVHDAVVKKLYHGHDGDV